MLNYYFIIFPLFQIRDTSVLVRLCPAWEDLKNYLIAKGRKCFEVYICIMSERDYALEMWRLLDPEGSLISHSELLDRVVCVKPGNIASQKQALYWLIYIHIYEWFIYALFSVF